MEHSYPAPAEDPIDFVARLGTGDHSILVHENPSVARRVESEFLRIGLEHGEHAVYISAFETPAKLAKSLRENGVDVSRYIASGLLTIQWVPSPADDQQGGAHAMTELRQKLQPSIGSPFRLVGRLYAFVTPEQVRRNLEVETVTQQSAKMSGGSIICSYDAGDVKLESYPDWFASVVEQHHALISVPRKTPGVGFFMR